MSKIKLTQSSAQSHTQNSASFNSENDRTESRKLSKRVRLFPIVFYVTYLTFTVLLFAFGPWPYPVVDTSALYTFLTLAHLALLLGYLTAVFGRPRGYYGQWSVQRLIVISLIVNLLLFFPTSAFRTGSVIPNVFGALADLGDAYTSSRLERGGFPLIEYLRFFLGPLISLLLPLTVFYWGKLNLRTRIIAVLGIGLNLSVGISIGVNRDLAFLAIFVPWLLLARYISASQFTRQIRIPKLRLVLGSIAGITLFFFFFATAMSSRPSGLAARFFSPLQIYGDTNHPLVRNLPDTLQTGVFGLSSYLSQGYYALYLSLQKSFVPMYGVGHSMFVTRQAVRLTGLEELQYRSYPDRILLEDGWDSYGQYTTIYPWIASDISFPGTILVMVIIGRFFALAWLDTINGKNPFAVVIFAQFIIMLSTFPTVNWIFNGGEGFSSFWVLFLLWQLTRRKWTLRTRQMSISLSNTS